MKQFDDTLTAYRNKQVPALPNTFATDVLRKIREEKATPNPSWFSSIIALIKPPLLYGAVAASIMVAALAPLALNAPSAKPSELDIFSTHSQYLPSGKI